MSTISSEMPLCGGDVRVGTRKYPAPARKLPPRDPGLLAAQQVATLRLDRLRPQRCEIGARLRLGEALTPDLLGREDRPHVTLLLLLCSEGEQRRARGRRARRSLRTPARLSRRVPDRRRSARYLGGRRRRTRPATLARRGPPRSSEPAIRAGTRSSRRARAAIRRGRGNARRGMHAPPPAPVASSGFSASFTAA